MSDPATSSEELNVEVHQYAPLTYSQEKYYASQRGQDAHTALKQLVTDDAYITDGRLGEDSGDVEFIDRHLRYLSSHPGVELKGYLTNLRLMTSAKRNRR